MSTDNTYTEERFNRQGRLNQLAESIVELARRWYKYGNESELASAVQEYEMLLREQEQP